MQHLVFASSPTRSIPDAEIFSAIGTDQAEIDQPTIGAPEAHAQQFIKRCWDLADTGPLTVHVMIEGPRKRAARWWWTAKDVRPAGAWFVYTPPAQPDGAWTPDAHAWPSSDLPEEASPVARAIHAWVNKKEFTPSGPAECSALAFHTQADRFPVMPGGV